MAKAIFFTIYLDKVWAETMISQPIFYLCQQVLFLDSNTANQFQFLHESLYRLVVQVYPFIV